MRHDEALRAAVTSTFERLAFMVADPELSPEKGVLAIRAGCRVRFRGRISGVLEAEAYGDLLSELAMNMLALESPASAAEELSALSEVSNVICGNVLPALCGAHAVFDLSAPEPRSGAVIRHYDGHDVLGRAVLGMGNGRIDVVVRQYA